MNELKQHASRTFVISRVEETQQGRPPKVRLAHVENERYESFALTGRKRHSHGGVDDVGGALTVDVKQPFRLIARYGHALLDAKRVAVAHSHDTARTLVSDRTEAFEPTD